MKPAVNLMLTCLCDTYYGEVGIATVKVLEHLGCTVSFNANQTCCGQPAFNAGHWDEARAVANHCLTTVFADDFPVVIPSASCTAMVRDGYPMLFPASPQVRAFELAEFIVQVLEIRSIPSARPYNKRCAYHASCHGRAIGLKSEQLTLLSSIPGIELVPILDSEQCCGFGGSFCVTQGKLSAEIGIEKLRSIVESGADELIGGDTGCLLHLQGLIDRSNLPLRVRHFAEVLVEVMDP